MATDLTAAVQQSCAHWEPAFILMGNGCGGSGKGAWVSWEHSEVGAGPHRGTLRSVLLFPTLQG